MTDRVLQGVDAARRAGWRQYYQVESENKTLRRALAKLGPDRLKDARAASLNALREAARAWITNGGPVCDENGASVEFLVHSEHVFWEEARKALDLS